MIRSIFLLMSVLIGCVLNGQITSSWSIAEDSIKIGDEVELIYTLKAPKSATISAIDFSAVDSMESLVPTSEADTSSVPYYAEVDWEASFVDLDKKQVPYHLVKKQDAGNTYEVRDTFKATFWDIGVFQIPNPRVILDTASLLRIIDLESPVLMVKPPVITNPDTTAMVMPIIDIIPTELTLWDKLYPYLKFLLPLLALGLLLYLLLKPKKREEQVVYVTPPPQPAHVIALDRLDQIEREESWKKGNVKKYQSELTYTIREYLENRYSIKALESTTDEIVDSLSQVSLSADKVANLKQILQIADLVKFAKARPDQDINESFLQKARSFVIETKTIITSLEKENDAG